MLQSGDNLIHIRGGNYQRVHSKMNEGLVQYSKIQLVLQKCISSVLLR